ncbi:MAG TPA: hypothetical protein VFL54_06685 [Gammaproteobacteria bacterium]|nr:hypothetical protein [Gammaproteobacteria bacterium]
MVETALREAIYCPLQGNAVLRVDGADARAFLQSQLSNDVTQVTAAQSQLTSLNTAQGRTLALLRLFEFDDALHVSLPVELADPIALHLGKYILRSRVEIAAVPLAHAGIAGAAAETLLESAGVAPPSAIDAASAAEGLVAIRVRSRTGIRHELFGAADKLARIEARCSRADANEWLRLDTLAGLPRLTRATSGEFIPQMLGLDELGAINYRKGCYPGQEVIARVHYRGQVKRKLRMLRAAGVAAPGTAVYSDNGEGGGMILQSARDGDGVLLLAVAPAEWGEGSFVHLQTPDGPPAQLAPAVPLR